jgi:uncharacterized protein YjbI with pentapeptide repeats
MMASYIKSKVQQSLSFLMVLVIAFSVFSGVLFLNPSPSYAYNESDLSRARIGDKDLSGSDLSRARLSGADLSYANLFKANLSGAILIGADLSGADLSRAKLSEAKLSQADLSQADLSRANLSEARLNGAIADTKTIFPDGFDAVDAGVDIRP